MGKFIISESAEGYRFMFQNAKGEILGLSHFYKDQASCRNAIKYVQNKCNEAPIDDEINGSHIYVNPPKFVLYKDNNDMFRFNFEGETGDIIIEGAAYTLLQHCLDAIANIRYNVTGVKQA